MKSILMVAALSVASLSLAVASSKSYEVVLPSAAQAGQTELSAGHYMVKVDGNFAAFTNTGNRHTVMVPVTVETMKSKAPVTAVDSEKANGVSKIVAIELRDTTTKLEF